MNYDPKNPASFPPDELLQGYKVEAEHGGTPSERLTTGIDHIKEDKNYYDKLDIMEHTPLSRLQSLRKCMNSSLQKTSGEAVKEAMKKPLHATGQGFEDVYMKIPGSQHILTSNFDSSNPSHREALHQVIKKFRKLYVR